MAPSAAAVPEIRASSEVATFIRLRGGHVYVWLDRGGLVHTQTEPPSREKYFIEIQADDFRFHQDPSIETPAFWRLYLRRLPRAHLEAHWNGEAGRWPGGGT